MSEEKKRYSSYLSYLPEMYSSGEGADNLEKFLNIFKAVLTENPSKDYDTLLPLPNEGIEELLDRVHEFFNPHLAPGSEIKVSVDANDNITNHEARNFLSWLADWVTFAQKVHFNDEDLRMIIPRIIPLYAKRGTREGLKEYLEIFSDPDTVSIYETQREKERFASNLQSAANRRFLLRNNYVFGVRIDLTKSSIVKQSTGVPEKEEIEYILTLFNQILCHEKPAHTDVILTLHVADGLQIAVTSTIALNTKIGFGIEIVETTASFDLA